MTYPRISPDKGIKKHEKVDVCNIVSIIGNKMQYESQIFFVPLQAVYNIFYIIN